MLLKDEADFLKELRIRFKQRRISCNLTQKNLSEKSGVSLGSLKRFEAKGEISLRSLVKLSIVLGSQDDFDLVFLNNKTGYNTIQDVIREPKIRYRVRNV